MRIGFEIRNGVSRGMKIVCTFGFDYNLGYVVRVFYQYDGITRD